jgi:hypothetical protein
LEVSLLAWLLLPLGVVQEGGQQVAQQALGLSGQGWAQELLLQLQLQLLLVVEWLDHLLLLKQQALWVL